MDTPALESEFDPLETLQRALAGTSAEAGMAALREHACDPERFAAVTEAVRAISSQSTDRGVDAARLLVTVTADELVSDAGRAASAHRALARALAWAGRFEDAIDAGREAARRAEAEGSVEEAVRARLVMMHPLTELGRLPEAIESGRHAWTLATDAERHDLAARADINLGIALRRRDEPTEAVACFRRARPHLRDEPAMLASLENSLGEALIELQSFDDAEAAFEAARAGFEAAGASLQAAIAEENLAELAFRQGRLHRALALFETARRRLAGEETALHRARVLAEEADARALLGLHESAIGGYAVALPLLDDHGLVLEAARARMGMGAALRALDRRSEAATAFAAASQAFTDLDHRTAQARCDLIRAGLELDADRLEAAGRLTARALPLFADRPADMAGARLLLGEIALRAGREDLAAAEFAAGLAIARDLDLAPLLVDLLHAVGRHQRRRGRWPAARATLDEAVEQLERVRGALQAQRFRTAFLGSRATVHEERLAMLLESRAEPDAEVSVAEVFLAAEQFRQRGLLEELVAVEARHDGRAGSSTSAAASDGVASSRAGGETRRLEGALAAERHALNVLYSRMGDATASGERDLRSLRAEIRMRERSAAEHAMRLEASDDGSSLLAAPLTLEAIQRDLEPGTRMIVFAEVEGWLARFVVDPTSTQLDPAIVSVPELEAAVRRLRFQMERGLRAGGVGMAAGPRARRLLDDARRAAVEVHRAVLRDLPAAADDVTHLVLVPAGPLAAVPPGVLHDGESWLASRFAITLAPSASVHHRIRARGPSGCCRRLVVGVADPMAPRIEDEARSIAADLAEAGIATVALLGADATASAVLSECARSGAVHLASHGRFDVAQPHASGLRMADRWLTVGDLAGLRLDADLVTLSGCETALGMAESGEIVGVARALLAAGARRVVASTWRVDDAITRTVMERLHEHVAEQTSGNSSGVFALDVARALALAHDGLADEYPHPAHWGGFVLMGRN